MIIPDSMFTAYSWVEINIFMYVNRNMKDGVLQVSLRAIAEEFGVTRSKVNYLLHKFYDQKLLTNTQQTPSKHPANTTATEYQQVRTTQQTPSKHPANTKQTVEARRYAFGERLIPYISQYGKQEIRRFFDYWTEMNPNGQKMRFEKEKTFEVSKRLARWNMNQNYDKGKDYEQRQQDERQQRLNEYASVAAAFARQAEEDLRSRSAENQEGIS